MQEKTFSNIQIIQISFIISETVGRFKETEKWIDFYGRIGSIREYVQETLLGKPYHKIDQETLKSILKLPCRKIPSGDSYLENEIENIYKIFASLAKKKKLDFV